MTASRSSGSPGALRRQNRAQVLRVVRERGPLTRREIVGITSLSMPTVNAALADLAELGYTTESVHEPAVPKPGPRAKSIRFRDEMAFVIGVDVGGTKVLTHLTDLAGTLISVSRVDIANCHDRSDILDAVESSICTAMTDAGVDAPDIWAISVGTPGVVDPETGRVSLSPQLPNWDGVALADEIHGRVACPVYVENEVQLAVLGERWRGAARDVTDAVYMNIGIGIGLGVLIGGKVHRGSSGAAGEIGYLPILPPNGEAPHDGVGALEFHASGAAMARKGQALARSPEGQYLRGLVGGDLSAVRSATVFRAAQEGDMASARLVREVAELLARAAACVCLVLDPGTLILGGGLSQAGEWLASPIRKQLRSLLPRVPEIRISELGDLAVVHGAVRLSLDDANRRLYARGRT